MAKRYQRGNQKPDIKDGHPIQWPKDTKGVIRSQISKTDMHYNGQKIPKGSNQKPDIKDGHPIQWPKDTKGK
jgi:hypothetical protein